MRAVRWGVLGTAKIAREHVIPALARAPSCRLLAVASRREERARAVAEAYKIARAYGSYDPLLADPEIDAVFVPLPNHLHVPWTLRCLEAGKHVLCEKPIAMDAEQAAQLHQAACRRPQLRVMEAFMYRFHPQWRQTKRWVDEGRLGRLVAIHSVFAYHNTDPGNIRNQPAAGGGGLMDIGCYCVSLSRWLVGRQPQRVVGRMLVDSAFGTDWLTSGLLDFGEVVSSFSCSTQAVPTQWVHVIGSEARVELEIPFNAPSDRPSRLWLRDHEGTREIQCPVADQYALQVEAFSAAVLADQPVPTPLDDAVANMRVIDALKRSARQNTWVEC